VSLETSLFSFEIYVPSKEWTAVYESE